MQWEKTISIRITIRRLVGVIVAVSTVVNLVIVGAVVGAESPPIAPAITPSPSMTSALTTAFSPTIIFTSSATSETTLTPTPSVTPTDTLTATQTLTDTPGPTPCVKRYDWPTYRIQRGNTLYWLASATGSTVQELMLANCLTSDLIYRGQMLHVPRLPISTFTPTNTPPTPRNGCDRAEFVADVNVLPGTVMLPGAAFIKTWRLRNAGSCTWTTAYSVVYMDGETFRTPRSTTLPVNVPPGGIIDISLNMTAPSVPGSYGSSWMFRNASGTLFGIGEQPNLPWSVSILVIDPTLTPGNPIGFQNPSVCVGSDNGTNVYLAFAVTLLNVPDVSSVTAVSGQSPVVPLQTAGGGVYSGAVISSYSPGMVVPYYFVAQSKSGQIRSDDYSAIPEACGPAAR